MAQSFTLHGSAVKVKVNGQDLGIAQSISWSQSYGINTIMGIDSPFPQEIAPGHCSISGTISGIRIIGDGGLEGQGLLAYAENMLQKRYSLLQVVDRTNGDNILRVNQAMFSDQNWNISARGLVTFSVKFDGILATNDSFS